MSSFTPEHGERVVDDRGHWLRWADERQAAGFCRTRVPRATSYSPMPIHMTLMNADGYAPFHPLLTMKPARKERFSH